MRADNYCACAKWSPSSNLPERLPESGIQTAGDRRAPALPIRNRDMGWTTLSLPSDSAEYFPFWVYSRPPTSALHQLFNSFDQRLRLDRFGQMDLKSRIQSPLSIS